MNISLDLGQVQSRFHPSKKANNQLKVLLNILETMKDYLCKLPSNNSLLIIYPTKTYTKQLLLRKLLSLRGIHLPNILGNQFWKHLLLFIFHLNNFLNTKNTPHRSIKKGKES